VSDRSPLGDRELDAILERLDALSAAVERISRRLEALEGLEHIRGEIAALSHSLESLAYAALGQRGPQVRRQRPPS
jgi:hypothetical protein